MTPTTTASLRTVTSWVAIAGVGFLAVGGFALSQPTTQLVDEDVSFTHRGGLTYSAPASPPLFPDGVTTGDPVFTRLADRVAITFTHGIDTEGAVAVDGTVVVDALLTGSGGWTRTVDLGEPQPVADGATEVDVEVDLPALRALAAEAASITGTPVGQLQLTVAPRVDVIGTVAGQVVEERFEPTFAFTLDDVALRPSAPAATGTGDPGAGEGEDERGGFTVEQVGTVAVPTEQVSVLPLPLPGPDVTVAVARTAGPFGAALLLVAGLLALSTRPKGDEAARIAARHGRLLVPIRSAGGAQHRPVIELATIVDLVRVAEHHERLVLHHVADGQHTYLVEVAGTAYRYTSTAARPSDVTNLHERRRRLRHSDRTIERLVIRPEAIGGDGAPVEGAGGAELSWASDALREATR